MSPPLPSRNVNAEYLDGLVALATGNPSVPRRIVDGLVPCVRTRPMKVLCLGQSRTGTVSLRAALETLGYRPYHMVDVLRDAPVSVPAWGDALRWKFMGVGKPWTREDFDKLIGTADCVADVPCNCFAEEFVQMYPEAKVILTKRPVKSWLESMRSSAIPMNAWPQWKWVAWADPDLTGPFREFADTWMPYFFGDFSDTSADEDVDPRKTAPKSAAAKYLEYYDHIRAICPPERLLELDLGEGYDKLCPFLGVPAPETPYPNTNSVENFLALHAAILERATRMAVSKALGGIVLMGTVMGVAAFLRTSLRVRFG